MPSLDYILQNINSNNNVLLQTNLEELGVYISSFVYDKDKYKKIQEKLVQTTIDLGDNAEKYLDKIHELWKILTKKLPSNNKLPKNHESQQITTESKTSEECDTDLEKAIEGYKKEIEAFDVNDKSQRLDDVREKVQQELRNSTTYRPELYNLFVEIRDKIRQQEITFENNMLERTTSKVIKTDEGLNSLNSELPEGGKVANLIKKFKQIENQNQKPNADTFSKVIVLDKAITENRHQNENKINEINNKAPNKPKSNSDADEKKEKTKVKKALANIGSELDKLHKKVGKVESNKFPNFNKEFENLKEALKKLVIKPSFKNQLKEQKNILSKIDDYQKQFRKTTSNNINNQAIIEEEESTQNQIKDDNLIVTPDEVYYDDNVIKPGVINKLKNNFSSTDLIETSEEDENVKVNNVRLNRFIDSPNENSNNNITLYGQSETKTNELIETPEEVLDDDELNQTSEDVQDMNNDENNNELIETPDEDVEIVQSSYNEHDNQTKMSTEIDDQDIETPEEHDEDKNNVKINNEMVKTPNEDLEIVTYDIKTETSNEINDQDIETPEEYDDDQNNYKINNEMVKTLDEDLEIVTDDIKTKTTIEIDDQDIETPEEDDEDKNNDKINNEMVKTLDEDLEIVTDDIKTKTSIEIDDQDIKSPEEDDEDKNNDKINNEMVKTLDEDLEIVTDDIKTKTSIEIDDQDIETPEEDDKDKNNDKINNEMIKTLDEDLEIVTDDIKTKTSIEIDDQDIETPEEHDEDKNNDKINNEMVKTLDEDLEIVTDDIKTKTSIEIDDQDIETPEEDDKDKNNDKINNEMVKILDEDLEIVTDDTKNKTGNEIDEQDIETPEEYDEDQNNDKLNNEMGNIQEEDVEIFENISNKYENQTEASNEIDYQFIHTPEEYHENNDDDKLKNEDIETPAESFGTVKSSDGISKTNTEQNNVISEKYDKNNDIKNGVSNSNEDNKSDNESAIDLIKTPDEILECTENKPLNKMKIINTDILAPATNIRQDNKSSKEMEKSENEDNINISSIKENDSEDESNIEIVGPQDEVLEESSNENVSNNDEIQANRNNIATRTIDTITSTKQENENIQNPSEQNNEMIVTVKEDLGKKQTSLETLVSKDNENEDFENSENVNIKNQLEVQHHNDITEMTTEDPEDTKNYNNKDQNQEAHKPLENEDKMNSIEKESVTNDAINSSNLTGNKHDLDNNNILNDADIQMHKHDLNNYVEEEAVSTNKNNPINDNSEVQYLDNVLDDTIDNDSLNDSSDSQDDDSINEQDKMNPQNQILNRESSDDEDLSSLDSLV